jgi:acetyl esterase
VSGAGGAGESPRAGALHPQIRELLDSRAAAPLDADGPAGLEAMRAGYLQTALELGGALEPVARVEDVVIPRPDGGRVPARAYWPQTCDEPAGCIVWLHGGGWCLGDLEGFDRVSRSLANAACARVLTVDYRLAPEHPHPAGLEDAEAAVAWARGAGAEQLGYDPGCVAVGGDSAGGNLAAIAVRKAGDLDRPGLRAQLLVYPATDAAMDTPSYRAFADGPMLTAEEMRRCWATYLGPDGAAPDREHPDVSPLRAGDLGGLPPTIVIVAANDPLCDDGIAYADRLREAGVECELGIYRDMTHGFLRWGGVVERSREAVEQLAGFARARLSA